MIPDELVERAAKAIAQMENALWHMATERRRDEIRDVARAALEAALSDALVIERDDVGYWQVNGKAWHVLNAAAAFGHPGGSVALLQDFANAVLERTEEP